MEKGPISCERAAAVASPLSGFRGCTVCPVQNPSGSSNSISVTENTDSRPGSETAWQGSGRGQRGWCEPVFRRGVAKWKGSTCQVLVFLAGIALYDVYESVPAVKIRSGPYGSLCSDAFYMNRSLSLLSLCELF